MSAITETVRERGVHLLYLQYVDVLGMVKEVVVPAAYLERAFAEGIILDGDAPAGEALNDRAEIRLVPDPTTFALASWQCEAPPAARLICDVLTMEGNPWPYSPRGALIRAIGKAAAMGFAYQVGVELEFFLLPMDMTGPLTLKRLGDEGGYLDITLGAAAWIRQEFLMALADLGIQVESGYHEVSRGQHEFDLAFTDALAAADNVVTARRILKEIALRHGMCATFMPKPVEGCDGSGMHIQQILLDAHSGENAFADPNGVYGLAEVGRKFIAGQLEHARGMVAILAPLVNSYKRLVPGYEAPVLVSWGRNNRSSLVRVPQPFHLEDTRLELRCPDPSCNPYLALAVMLQCGLDGIKRGLGPVRPLEENLHEADWARIGFASLPSSLAEALDELEKDQVVQDALGAGICRQFLAAKRAEWTDYSVEVTPWEHARYLGIF